MAEDGVAHVARLIERLWRRPRALRDRDDPPPSAGPRTAHEIARCARRSATRRAPGTVWTPLNPADAGTPPEKIAEFGTKTELGRPAQPEEIAPAYVFFASDADSSFITGQVLPALGGASAG